MSITDLTSTTTSPPLTTKHQKSVLFFWASWHEPSAPGGSTDQIVRTLASTLTSSSNIQFYRVEAEVVSDVSAKYNVTVVPTFVLLDTDGTVVDKIEGADDVARLTLAVSALRNRGGAAAAASSSSQSSTRTAAVTQPSKEEILTKRLESLIHSSQVMLFMKGIPTAPKCGFSRQAVEILSSASIPFGSFDILTDEDVRQGLKTYSDWPTYPQLYVKGELMGGLDIMKEMAEEGDLAEQLNVAKSTNGVDGGKTVTLEERLKQLVNRHRVMLFMKGLPSAPKCGFSRQICEILDQQNKGTLYDTFNILEDDEVRQGLKKFSDWPTYPQLYVDGELIGGLDIVKEMQESGELADLLNG